MIDAGSILRFPLYKRAFQSARWMSPQMINGWPLEPKSDLSEFGISRIAPTIIPSTLESNVNALISYRFGLTLQFRRLQAK